MDSFNVNPKDIIVRERSRKDFSHVNELCESIERIGSRFEDKKKGLLHPIVVHKEVINGEDKYVLLAGECRLRATVLLGWDEIPCTYMENLNGEMQKVVELEENVRRSDLEWSERIDIERQIDEFHRKEALQTGEKWNKDKLGAVIGVAPSTARIQVHFAGILKERPDLKDKVKRFPIHTAMKKVKQILEGEKIQMLALEGKITLSTELRLGKAEELILEVESDSVDLILTDPPFGIENLEVRTKTRGKSRTGAYKVMLTDEDNATREKVLSLFDVLAPEMFRVLKEGCYFYVFMAHGTLEGVKERLRTAGLTVFPVPIVWDKGKTTGPFMGYKYAPSHEIILYGCKPGENMRRLENPCRDILLYKPISSKDKLHPLEKPLELLRYLIKQSTRKNELVFDMFAGSGATLVAAEETGRRGLAFEMEKGHFNNAQARLARKKVDDDTNS